MLYCLVMKTTNETTMHLCGGTILDGGLGSDQGGPRGGGAVVTRAQIEERLGVRLVRGWILDGAGPARYGWASVRPCRQRWEGPRAVYAAAHRRLL
jgi:hypothetical protein